jgi:hypothetical protein
MPDDFLTVAEIASILKLNQHTVRNWTLGLPDRIHGARRPPARRVSLRGSHNPDLEEGDDRVGLDIRADLRPMGVFGARMPSVPVRAGLHSAVRRTRSAPLD